LILPLKSVFLPLQGFEQVHHLLGNHELYNFGSRLEDLSRHLNQAPLSYRSAPVKEHARFRWIFLNPYDISVLGSKDSQAYQQALDTMLSNHTRDFRTDKDWVRLMY
jgi:hypothetical protein